jgi:hypothetical protein
MQLTYTQNPAVALEGALADTTTKHADSFIAEGSAIPAGSFVVKGTADHQAKLPASSAELAAGRQLGFTIYSPTREQSRNVSAGFQGQISDGAVSFQERETIGVLRRGRIYAVVEDAHDFGDPVYIRHTANGGNTRLGGVRTDADTANATLVPGAVIRSTGVAGALAVIEINLP